LVSIFVAVIGGILWTALREPREPIYQGKPLSVWLERYVSGGSYVDFRPDSEADEAVRQIGTNAIPLLLRMVRARDSKTKLALAELLNKQKLVEIRYPRSWWAAYYQSEVAVQAFGALGANASNADPQLIQTYQENVGPESQLGCLEALGRIGPAANQAIPDLLGALTNVNPVLRWAAVEALVKIHLEPGLLMPILIDGLQGEYVRLRLYSVRALGEFGKEAKAAVPGLTQLLSDPDTNIVTEASNALKAIDPEAAAKAGVK